MTSTPDPQISFVSPVYGCPEAVLPLVERIAATCAAEQWDWELILVEDRCPRGSWQQVQQACERWPQVRGLRLSRNFGQHPAIQAGLDHSRGTWVVVLDCDLQDQPEEVPKLMEVTRQGYKIVRARRLERQHSYLRRLASRLFYGLLSYLTDTRQSPEVANFGVYHRTVIDSITGWSETGKFFPVIVEWVGFKSIDVAVDHAPRASGQSAYNFRSLVRLGIDVVMSFSDKPLRLIVKLGLVIAALTAVASMVVIIGALGGAFSVPGWASLMLSSWFMGGVIIVVLGVSALYIGKVLEETKGRPSFIVEETVE